MRSASSRPLWLLLSAAVAFGVLAWTAQRTPPAPTFVFWVKVLPDPGSSTTTYTYDPTGKGFFRRSPPVTVMSGVDTITVRLRKLP